jgi:hypothetical protein
MSTYRAREMAIAFIEPVLHEFNYIPPDAEIQGQIINFFGTDVSMTKEVNIPVYVSEAQAIKTACVRAEWKPFDITQKLDKKEKKSLKRQRCDSSTDCAICLYECVDNVRLECEHDFCYKCIKKWLSIKRTCPVCDAKVSFETHKRRKRLRLRGRNKESK